MFKCNVKLLLGNLALSHLQQLARSWIGLATLDEFRFEFKGCLGVAGLPGVQSIWPALTNYDEIYYQHHELRSLYTYPPGD